MVARRIVSQIVPKIVTINIIIYFVWNFVAITHPQFMINNFLVSWDALEHGRIWTLFTSVFSHNMLFHLFINMFVFFNFGVIVENYLGPMRFLRFYLLAGMTGSLVHCLTCAFILKQPEQMALGASGAISGVVLLFALLYPQQKIFLLGIIPIPAIWAVVIISGIDIFGLIQQTNGISSPIGHGAHLGGALAGLIYFFVLKMGDSSVKI